MRLVMAVSADGYVSRQPNDNMFWLGPWDKAAFCILTGVGGGVLACGWRTWKNMPTSKLEGRRLIPIRSEWRGPAGDMGMTLQDFDGIHGRDGWLIGGQRIATNAIAMGLIDEAHICRSDRRVDQLGALGDLDPTPCTLDISMRGVLTKRMETRIGDTTVEVWRGT